MAAAAREAAARGYAPLVLDEPIVGEARKAAVEYAGRLTHLLATRPQRTCVISSGETTVSVRGSGRGGRNQEFALALLPRLPSTRLIVVASIGTDGIDGPTDAAGAIADSSTRQRADAAGLAPEAFLNDNNTYVFFERLGDLIKTGPTATNVGDLQVILVA